MSEIDALLSFVAIMHFNRILYQWLFTGIVYLEKAIVVMENLIEGSRVLIRLLHHISLGCERRLLQLAHLILVVDKL